MISTIRTATPETSGGAIQRPRLSARFRRDLSGYGFLAPWLVGFVLLTLGPTVVSFWMSLTSYDLRSADFVGVDNYARIATGDPRFWTSMKVTFTFVVLSVPAKLAFALLVAIILNQKLRGISLLTAIFYLPSLMGGSVAVGILWRQMFSRDGFINVWLHDMFGIQGMSWISMPQTSLNALVLLSVWQFGSSMIIFLAGLRQIPKDLYEAAGVDGAGTVKKFIYITVPLLTPVIFFNLVIQTIESFKSFTSAFVISNGDGGPIDSLLFYTLYLYQEAFVNFRIGYASALAWVLLAIIGLLTLLMFISARHWVHYDD